MGLPNPSRETKFSGPNADREILLFPVQLSTSRIGNLTGLIHILALAIGDDDDHTALYCTILYYTVLYRLRYIFGIANAPLILHTNNSIVGVEKGKRKMIGP